MVEFVKTADFLKSKKDESAAPDGGDAFSELLKIDGCQIAAGVIDFLSKAIVNLADGANCDEWHKITPNLEIYVTIKNRKEK